MRWNLSRKDPSLENTLVGFGLGGGGFELAELEGPGVEVCECAVGEAYPLPC